MKRLIICLLCCLAFSLKAQETLQEYYNRATAAYENKDYSGYLENIREADKLRPNHPFIVPKVAAAWALNGRKTRSIQKLRQMMLMDATYDFINNPDFESIKGYKGYDKLVALQKRLATVEIHDEVYMTIEAAALHPESFVVLEDGELLLGSIREKKIVKVDRSGKVSDWLETPYAVLGMKVDFKKGHLWVSTAAVPEMKGFTATDQGKSVVLQIDIRTAEILQGIAYDEESIIGDLVVDQQDRIWLSNSMTPHLSRTETDTTKYLGAFNRKQFDLSDGYFSLQGLTLTDDEEYLYFSDYITGLFRINIKEDNIEKVFAPQTSLLKGIDGLYYYKNTLLAIHNGTKPYRVVQYFLDETGTYIDMERVINRGGESLGEPTLGQVKDGYFYYVANSPWPFYDEQKNLLVDQLKPIEIRRIKLD